MNKILFIDDDSDIRETYKISMEMMFGDSYEIICLDVERDLEEMIGVLEKIEDKVTYFIDEKLKHSGKAIYSGLELIEKIRILDSKIPIYILTSFADEIDPYHGDIEFVIDKNHWDTEDEDEEQFVKRFLRHINTYKDIKSAQAQKFDELFEKSLFETLTVEEKEEFDALNLVRSKQLMDERIISEESLKKLSTASDQLDLIYKELTKKDHD